MMKQVALVLALAVAVLAHPTHHHKDHKEHHHHHHHPEPTKATFGGPILPWMPFPHFEEFALYTINDMVLLPGSAFVVVGVNGTCERVSLTDEMGGRCPVNQTVCDQIASTPCTPAVANATCFEPTKPGQNATAGLPTKVPEGEFGNGYPLGGPLCHVEALGQKFQPSSYTAIFTLAPTIQTCVFQVAPPPTVFPAPTGEPVLPADPRCPFIEM